MNEKNIAIWENIYANGLSNLKYPNEIFVRLFNKFYNQNNIEKVLDFGFGAGANLIHMANAKCEVYGVEVSKSAIEIVNEKLKSLELSAELSLVTSHKLPFDDNAFDMVVAWQVLAYNNLESFKLHMEEISRVLKPGGVFIGTMTAIGDITYQLSEKVSEYLYVSKVSNQEGATCIIVDKHEIQQFFEGENLDIGEYYFELSGVAARHWVVTYAN